MFFTIVTTIMTLLGLYACARLVWPLPLETWVRIVLCLLVLAAANKVILAHHFLPPNLATPRVLLALGWLHVSVMIMACLVFFADIGGLLLGLFGLHPQAPGWRFAIVALCGLAIGAWGIYSGTRAPEVVELDVPVRNLPPDLEGFRIGVLGDLHVSRLFGRSWVETITEQTNASQPDLIVLVGDMVDGSPSRLLDSVRPLSDLTARHGVYAVAGNHEYYSGLEAWREAFPEVGIHLLLNEHAVIEHEDARLVLAGLADRVTLRRNIHGERPDFAKAFKGAPQDADTIWVLLDHQPSGAREYAVHGVDLQLSGHTHGGVALPLRPLAARLNAGFVSGLYDVDGMPLVVTNGAGMWASMPFRFGVPPQILVVRLMPLS